MISSLVKAFLTLLNGAADSANIPKTDGQTAINERRVKLLERTLQSCQEDYVAKERLFAALETKAQSTGAVAGVFIAAALAFMQGDALPKYYEATGLTGIILLGAAILLLITSIAFSLNAIRVKRIAAPLEMADVIRMTNDMLNLEDSEFDQGRVENHLRDHIAPWPEVLKDMSEANSKKAWSVLQAQRLLAVAIMLVAGLLILILFKAITLTKVIAPPIKS